MCEGKIPDILHQVILIIPPRAIEIETSRTEDGSSSSQASIRGYCNDRRKNSFDDCTVDCWSYFMEKRELILCKAMQPENQGIFFVRIVIGREVNVKIPFHLQGRGIDAMVDPMVFGEIEDRSLEGAVDLRISMLTLALGLSLSW